MFANRVVRRWMYVHSTRLIHPWRYASVLLHGSGGKTRRFKHTIRGAQRQQQKEQGVKEVTQGSGGPPTRKRGLESTKNHVDDTATSVGTTGSGRGNLRGGVLPLCKPGREREVAYWLLGSAGITAGVMAVGAYVRLNESGLSMLDWRLLGRHLPNDDDEWSREFERYKTTPEYKQVHYNIGMEEYKRIYLNEWIHRMMGRFSGMCFGGGALFLAAVRGSLASGGYLLTLGVMSLGLSQAFVGKWMVESGFKEPETENKTPRVSPYRLSMHFTNALAIYSICLWNGLKLLNHATASVVSESRSMTKVRRLGKTTLASLFMTMLYGTIVAGNDAGLVCNTWPKMLDSYVPEDYYQVNTVKHLFEKAGVIQFNHRCLGYITATLAALTYWSSRASGVPAKARRLAMGTLHASALQVIVGIITVLKQVPMHAAMTHHVNAMAMWSMLLALLVRLR